MSEVKPTLVQAIESGEVIPLNSWLSNFPTDRWIDAQIRGGFWVLVNTVRVLDAYEYRIRFDVPVENATLIFPFVVKTSDSGIEKAFIDGVEYQVRSKENYGDMFIVSGQEFRFKCATKYKLSKQTVPILTAEYKQAVFENINFLDSVYIRLRYYFPELKTVNTVSVDYNAVRNTSPTFITSISTTCEYIPIHTTSSTFNNVNVFSAPVVANCKATTWDRFGGIWTSCDKWM